MSSIVTICNLALGSIGANAISAIDEASTEARACSTFYTTTLETALQAYPWWWAGETLSLAEVDNTKPNRWLYAYQRPSDCLKIRALLDESMADYLPYGAGITGGGHDRAIEGQIIYCDLSPAYLAYTKRFTDASLFPPLFADAFGMALAARIAMPVTRDLKIRAEAIQLARQAMAAAQEANAGEVAYSSDHTSDRVEARSPEYTTRRPTLG